MGGRFHGRPCPRRLIVGQLRALRRNSAVHHLSPSQCVPIRKAIANAVNAAFIAPPTTQGLGLRSTSYPAEPQYRDRFDIAGFLGCCHPTHPPQQPACGFRRKPPVTDARVSGTMSGGPPPVPPEGPAHAYVCRAKAAAQPSVSEQPKSY